MKTDKIIEKFGLRELRVIRGQLGQKMDESCIQQFVKGDPSGTGKYLEWMLYQAGGGKLKLDRSLKQWQEGEHNEPSLRDQLRDCWITTRTGEWKDDLGNDMKPVSREVALQDWEQKEEALKWYHVYGDEEYIEQGCFGFYRKWPGGNEQYSTIVEAVRRFHRHTQALKAKGKSIDLSLATYPNLTDLLQALKDVAAAELKADVDYDLVYSDEYLQVYCPYNIGASLKFGVSKWCTANESMFLSALGGEGKNRWKEYAGVSALYYCHFRNMPDVPATPAKHVAVQVNYQPVDAAQMDGANLAVAYAKYWDSEDKSNSLEEFLNVLTASRAARAQHLSSFKCAINAIAQHYGKFDRERIVTNFSP